MIRVGICGFGYWGPNLYRNFNSHPSFKVVAIADKSKARQDRVHELHPDLRTFDDAIEMIDNCKLDAVAIATPVATHNAIAAHALRKGKHVLVEKPLCERSAE